MSDGVTMRFYEGSFRLETASLMLHEGVVHFVVSASRTAHGRWVHVITEATEEQKLAWEVMST